MPKFTGVDITGQIVHAYGAHVVNPHVVQKVTTGVGDTAVSTVVGILGEGVWQGIDALYWQGKELVEGVDYHFHPGYFPNDPDDTAHGGAQAVDSWVTGGSNYSGSAYVVVKLPADAVKDDDYSELKAKIKALLVMDYDASGNELGLIYTANPANVFLDIYIRRRGNPKSRIHFPSWHAWKLFNAEQVPWVGGSVPGRPLYQNIANFTQGADGAMTKFTGGVSWNAGASTSSTIASGVVGFFEADIGSAGVGIGLTDNGSPRDIAHMQLGLYFHQSGDGITVTPEDLTHGNVWLVQGSTVVNNNFDTWVVGDRFRTGVDANGNWLVQKNGNTLSLPSLTAPSFPLMGGVVGFVDGTFGAGAELLRATMSPAAVGQTTERTRDRFLAGLAFVNVTDSESAMEAVLYVSCANYNDVDGQLHFIVPTSTAAPRSSTFNFTESNILEGTLKTYRLARDQRATHISGKLRDIDSQYYTETTLPVDRDQLEEVLNRRIDGGEVYLGTITQAQAKCVLNYQMRMTSDLDLFATFTADGTTFSVAPGDVVSITHSLMGWVDVQFLVIQVEDDESTEKADTRTYVCQIFNPATYSDDDQSPLVANVEFSTPSSLTPAPQTSSVDLTQTSEWGLNNSFTTRVEGTVNFDLTFKARQRARIWVQKPSQSVPSITAIVVTPDAPNFSFTAQENGTYTVFAVTENEIGYRDPALTVPDDYTSATIAISAPALTLNPPVLPVASFSVSSVEISWQIPANAERITEYEVWTDISNLSDLTKRVYYGGDNRTTLQFAAGAPTSVHLYVRSVNRMGQASSFIEVNSSTAVPIVQLSAPTSYTIGWNGLETIHTFAALPPSANVGQYQIATDSGFTNIVGTSKSGAVLIPLSKLPAGRSWNFYLRAVDNIGNIGPTATPTPQPFALPILDAPTIAFDPNRTYPFNAILTITTPGSLADRRPVLRTVVEVATSPAFSTILYTYYYDGVAETADISGRFATQPTVYVRAYYVDRTNTAGTVSSNASITFAALVAGDIGAGAVGLTQLASSIVPPQVVASLPSLPNAQYPNNDSIVFNQADGKLYRNVGNAWTAAVPTVDLTGQITTGQITNGAVDLSKFASGLRPIQSVSALPTLPDTTYPVGAIVWLTTDGKLYRNLANAWTASVPATDLTGQVVTAQIADAALTTAKFASGIEPVSIVSAVPGALSTRTIFNTTDGKLYRWNGSAYVATVPATDLTGQIVTAQITDAALTTAKFAAGIEPVSIVSSVPGSLSTKTIFNTADGKLYRWSGSAYVATTPATDLTGQITTTQITDNAVTTAKVAANAITAAKIAANTITANEIAADTITAAQIAAGAINTSELAAGAVVASKIAAGTITSNEIAATTILAGNIAAGAITTTKIATGAVTANEIAADTITAAQIAAGAVNTSELAAGAVVASKIAAGTITSNEIAATTILAGNIAAGAITTAKIATGAVTANEIAADTITAAQIASSAITASELAANSVYTNALQANAVTAAKVAAHTITANEIAAATITASEIAANAITAGKIAANAVTAGTIAAAAVSTTELAANAVTTVKIAAGAVTADKVAANSITATQLVVAGLSDNILLNPAFEQVTGSSADGWNAYGTAGYTMSFSQNSYVNMGCNGCGITSKAVPVSPGDVIAVRAQLSQTGGTHFVRAVFTTTKPAQDYIGTGTLGTTAYDTAIVLANNVAFSATITPYEYTVTVPAGYYWMSVVLQNNTASTSLYAWEVLAKRQIGDAFISNLKASKVIADTVGAGLIFADQIKQASYVPYQSGTTYAPITWDSTTYNPSNAITYNSATDTLTKVGTSGWNSAIASVNYMRIERGDGGAEWTINSTGTFMEAGLSVTYSAYDEGGMDFTFAMANDGTLSVYEGGVGLGTVGTWAKYDKLKIAFESGRVRYYKNNVAIFTSPYSPSATRRGYSYATNGGFRFIFAAYHSGSSISHPKLIQGGYGSGWRLNPLTGTQLFDTIPTWQNVNGFAAVLNAGATIKKVGGSYTSDSSARTVETIADGDGYIEAVIPNPVPHDTYVGLTASADTTYSFSTIDFSFNIGSTVVAVYERGVSQSGFIPVAPGDTIRIAIEGGVVKYRHNGAVVWTSTNQGYLAYPLRGKVAALYPNDFVNSLKLTASSSGAGEFNSGLTVTGVRAEDIARKVTTALRPDNRFRGNDSDAPSNVITWIDFNDVYVPFEDNQAYVALFLNVDDYQTNADKNMDSVDHVRVRVFNMFGDPILPYGFMYFPYTGRGLAAHFWHLRDFAEPRTQAVYSFELHNLYGYSAPIYFTSAQWATGGARSGTYSNFQSTPPIWHNRNYSPSGVVAVPVSDTVINVSWTQPAATTGATTNLYYRAYRSNGYGDDSSWTSVSSNTTGAAIAVTGLSPNTKYEFMVSVTTNSGGYNDSYMRAAHAHARTLTTAPPAPTYPAPTGVSASPTGTTTMNVTWTANGSPTNVEISRRNVTSGSGWSIIASAYAGAQPYGDTGLSAGTTYAYKIRNNYSGNYSNYSSEGQGTTQITAPASNTPSNLVASSLGYYSIQLSWIVNGSGSNHRIEYVVDTGVSDFTGATAITGASSPTTVGSLADGTTYRFRVRAESPSTSGWSNDALATTDTYVPPDPGNNCVVGDTPVLALIDGVEHYVPADTVVAGQQLVSIDAAGRRVVGEVASVHTGVTTRLYTIVTESGNSLTCSPGHPLVQLNNVVKKAFQIKTGDTVLVYNEVSQQARETHVTSVEFIDIRVPVFIFAMRNDEHTFVSGGLVSHNIISKL